MEFLDDLFVSYSERLMWNRLYEVNVNVIFQNTIEQ